MVEPLIGWQTGNTKPIAEARTEIFLTSQMSTDRMVNVGIFLSFHLLSFSVVLGDSIDLRAHFLV